MRRVGLIGFGSIAEHGHLPAWKSFPEVELVAVADISGQRLDRARASLPDVALYDSPLDLIARADVDVVDICTPPSTHVDLILAACKRELPDVVCEKPLVLSEDEYLRVAVARRQGGSRVISVNNWVHSDLHRHVLGALQHDAVGAVRSVELQIGRPGAALGNSSWVPRWRTNIAHAGGGIIFDHGWHQLYLMLRWMQSPLQSVSAITRTVDSRNHPVEDEALIDITFPSARGRIELRWTASGRSNGGVIRGTRGLIAIHDDGVVVANDAGRRQLPFAGRLTESSYHPDWFRAMFRSTVLAPTSGEAERAFAEAGALVSAIRAAYRSADRQGAPCRPALLAWETDSLATEGESIDDDMAGALASA